MKALILIAAAAALGACAETTQTAPGQFLISCAGYQSRCTSEAAKACPAGYDVGNLSTAATGNGTRIMMTVKCR